MGFSLLEELPKILWLVIGVAGFAAVIGLLLLLVDRGPKTRRDWWQAVCFLGPALLLLLLGLVYPAIRTTALSFFDRSGDSLVGLDNYVWMFTQPEILTVLRNTLLWVLFAPFLATATGLLYAILVDRSRFESVAKSLMFMPMAISFVGASIIWRFVYAVRPAESDQIGLLNQIVVWFGGEPQQWLLNQPLNTLLLIVVLIWVQAGFAMVVLSAAIKAIPAEIIEAARLDGTTPWQLFRHITLPSVWPTVTVVLITISVQTLKVFDIVRTMTGGQFDTSVIANEMYNQAFRYGELGQGSALAVFLFVLVIPLVLVQMRTNRRAREQR
ncbi:carbohydrate ABC transporter membrane protein 1, CUT1 family [Marinactinospora thermotolerans DSM 45154]|uniref:Carbohydrate ABC transporter membrane protein 1, CUT1 family n=1 Tax=Marinactinospora thermotolerans DSM 45154 TaxID=1122192 RepID=A0A1T4RUG2_9ACTN|nr:sugar ABC transporter permease [Marinactinospora thermotolerans]SKA19609.1 carbohydrate ABC transporter membrane protein 1, CUT1 family [Marinactinospora thermotolerans DSM 45154]